MDRKAVRLSGSFVAGLLLAVLMAFTRTEHPNFTGKWVLDAAKSEQSQLTPEAMSYTVHHEGNQITADRTVTTPNGESTAHLVWAIDGKPWKNQWKQGEISVVGLSTLSWDGATLVIKTAISADGQDISQTDRWTLGADGKEMTVERSIDAGGQSLSAKIVMRKAS
jgi:hypothetical protein